MEQERPEEHAEPHGQPVSPAPLFWRTFRRGVRAAWDSLGLICAISFTLFLATAIPFWVAYEILSAARSAPPVVAWACGAALYVLLVPPLIAGACSVARQSLAHRIAAEEEPSYAEIWRTSSRVYGRAVALGAAQFVGTAVLAANIGFYLSRSGLAFFLLVAIFGYLFVFWLMSCVYHWPLLVAADAGIIRRDDGGKARLAAVFRNGFVLAVSAPGFTFALLLAIIVPAIPLVLSGVGMALLLPGYAAFLTTQATWDQLVRFGLIPPAPDPDAPVQDPGFRL